ncbi:MAG: hypothetical protein ACR2FU_08385 [Streptosporangiaceae bacterium]
MFHVISARLNRLARKLAALRNGQVNEYATWYGWTAVQASPGTWQYRDPRFTQLVIDRNGWSTDCDHCDGKVADWIDNRVLDGIYTRNGSTWTRAALVQRISRRGSDGRLLQGGDRDAR